MLLHLLTPVLSALVINKLKVGELEAAEAMMEVEVILGEVSDLLKDGRSFILATQQPTNIGKQSESIFILKMCHLSVLLPVLRIRDV